MFSPRNLFFMLVSMMVTVVLNAEPITREQARLRAQSFLEKASGSRNLAPVVNGARLSPRRLARKGSSDVELYYVFNRGDNQGFVIATGDDRLRPVIGYTDEGEFDYNNLPDNMKFWLEGYEAELKYLSEHPEAKVKIVLTVAGEPVAVPMKKGAESDSLQTVQIGRRAIIRQIILICKLFNLKLG